MAPAGNALAPELGQGPELLQFLGPRPGQGAASARLGSADLVQRSATVLEEHALTGDVRVWQGKRQRLLMELADMDRQGDARLRTSQAAVHALAKAGIQAHSGTSASPASHLAAGKVVELCPGTS